MSAKADPAISGRRRALAWLSILCAVLFVVALVVFSLGNLPALTGVVLGFAVAVAGAWWLITEHPPRRWVGLAGAVIGVAIVVAAVWGGADADRPVPRVALVVALFVVMVGSARLAVMRDLSSITVSTPSSFATACTPTRASSA